MGHNGEEYLNSILDTDPGRPHTVSHVESSVHWGMVCDVRSGGELLVDGELLYQNGEFRI